MKKQGTQSRLRFGRRQKQEVESPRMKLEGAQSRLGLLRYIGYVVHTRSTPPVKKIEKNEQLICNTHVNTIKCIIQIQSTFI